MIETRAAAVAGIPLIHSHPSGIEIQQELMEGWGGSREVEPPIHVVHSVGTIDLDGRRLISPSPAGGYNFSYYAGDDERVIVGYRGAVELPTGPTRLFTQALYSLEDGFRYELRYESPNEAAWLQRLWLRTLFMHAVPSRGRGLAAHGCGFLLPGGGAVLLPGVSGAGKSTFARQFAEDHGSDALLSDDRLLLTAEPGELRLWGTPWFSQAMAGSSGDGPLQAAVFLHHGPGAVVRDIAPGDALRRVMRTLAFPFWKASLMDAALELVERLISTVPLFEFSYRPSPGVTTVLLDELERALG